MAQLEFTDGGSVDPPVHSSEQTNIWPVEIDRHPGFRDRSVPEWPVEFYGFRQPDPRLIAQNLVTSLGVVMEPTLVPETPIARIFPPKLLAHMAFDNGAKFFRSIIRDRIRIKPESRFDGESIMCAWPTKFCPVGCDFCFFASPRSEKDRAQSEWTAEGVEKLVEFLEKANMGELRIAGGGEPFLKMPILCRLLEAAKAKEINLVTSGVWAKKEATAEKKMDLLHEHLDKNPHSPKVQIRLSFDRDHFDKISKDGTFTYALNMINTYRRKYLDDDSFRFVIHTMKDDSLIEEFLAELPVASRTPVPEKRRELITLEDGFTFTVKYAKVFYSDRSVDLNDTPVVERNVGIFDHDVQNEQHLGNFAVVPGKDGQRGLNFSLHYNGALFGYGASSPDNEASLYEDTYEEVLDKLFGDVLSLAVLEKGNEYRDDIIAEVNPLAVVRAKAMGIRDGYSRVSLEEERTRMYVSIRILQDYIQEGRVSAEEMESWLSSIKSLVGLSKEQLIAAYRASSCNIVAQYLTCPHLNFDDLVLLYELVQRGHYDVRSEEMISQVNAAKTLTPEQKQAFFDRIGFNPGERLESMN